MQSFCVPTSKVIGKHHQPEVGLPPRVPKASLPAYALFINGEQLYTKSAKSRPGQWADRSNPFYKPMSNTTREPKRCNFVELPKQSSFHTGL